MVITKASQWFNLLHWSNNCHAELDWCCTAYHNTLNNSLGNYISVMPTCAPGVKWGRELIEEVKEKEIENKQHFCPGS